jgi:SAM-dependent methyltransferase
MFDFLKKSFILKNDIACFSVDDKATKSVTEFYKESPFPNYKETDDKLTISQKGDRNLLAAQFKKNIGYKKNVLEVGCGTGQLAIYFSIGTNNNVVGLDPTIDSLQLARNFSKKNEIKNIQFVNADIFDDVLKDNFFDFIWCSGVLHHTKNPYDAFEILIKSLKKEGFVLIGLYNRIGRIRTIIRKYFYKLFGTVILNILDPTLRNLKKDSDERKAWIRDQYIHPIESLHTLDDVLGWFSKNDIDYINSIPACDFEGQNENLFIKESKGTFFSRINNQISMIFNNLGSDGGLFVVIGKKNG